MRTIGANAQSEGTLGILDTVEIWTSHEVSDLIIEECKKQNKKLTARDTIAGSFVRVRGSFDANDPACEVRPSAKDQLHGGVR